jgi:phosphatidylserine/phosphatidylglycerophosphate/cardiolipin synthase-like enzyme
VISGWAGAAWALLRRAPHATRAVCPRGDGGDGDGAGGGLRRRAGTRETTGSTTRLLVDNSEVRALRASLMASAERSIHFTALLIEDDALGAETAEALAAAARRGVEVRVIVDATTQYAFGGR